MQCNISAIPTKVALAFAGIFSGIIICVLILFISNDVKKSTNEVLLPAPSINHVYSSAPSESEMMTDEKIQSLNEIMAIKFVKTQLIDAYNLDRKRANDFAGWIYQASKAEGVPFGHLASLIATESSFRYQARSHVGAVGPAQIRPRFWAHVCDGDLLNPEDNVMCGAHVLKSYKQRCGDWDCAFAMYNVGPGNFTKPEFQGAKKRYITKISRYQNLFSGLYSESAAVLSVSDMAGAIR